MCLCVFITVDKHVHTLSYRHARVPGCSHENQQPATHCMAWASESAHGLQYHSVIAVTIRTCGASKGQNFRRVATHHCGLAAQQREAGGGAVRRRAAAHRVEHCGAVVCKACLRRFCCCLRVYAAENRVHLLSWGAATASRCAAAGGLFNAACPAPVLTPGLAQRVGGRCCELHCRNPL